MIDARMLEANLQAKLANGGPALALPLPQKAGGLVVVFMEYGETVRSGVEELVPPCAVWIVDPERGDVVAREARVPRDFGVEAAPDTVVQGFGLEVDGETYWAEHDRFLAIAPRVWAAFRDHDTVATLDAETRALLEEHDNLFARIAKKPLLPYYEHVGAEYFAWVRS